MSDTYYSWIPNLTSKINFQYITDEIDFDNSKIKVEQLPCEEYGKNKKKFSLTLNSSDQLKAKQKGPSYKVVVSLTKESDKSILGEYEEFILSDKVPEDKKKYLTSSFKIEENGFISIYNIQWNVSRKTTKDGYDHKLIGIYSNIKYILHKDVHHDPKEDIELGIYTEKDEYKYTILDKFILSIKAFERQIKDDSAPLLKLDFYEKKLLQASGYNAYLKTYAVILKREANEEQKAKIEETLLLANNILESSKYLIEQYKNSKKQTENFLFVILAIMTLFLPALIASLNLTDSCEKILFTKPEQPFVAASIYTLIAIAIGYHYSYKKVASILYYKLARSSTNTFMKLRNWFANKLINILVSLVIYLIIFIGFLICALAFPVLQNWIFSLFYY